MVSYIGVRRIREIVQRVGLGQVLRGMAEAIEADFARWPEFEKVARIASHSAQGVIELMPASDGRRYAFKYVNGHPANTARRLLTVTAFGVLADVDTGYPLLLSEMTFATALRTAATSALVARRLARPGAGSMAMVGNGAQAEFQVLAFREIVGISEFRLVDPDAAATAKLVANMRTMGFAPGAARVCAATEEAVRGADIVTTATAAKRRAAVLTPGMVEPGMHLNAVGGDCPGKTELDPGILLRPDVRVFVEYEPQTRIEGDIQQLPADFPVTELWRVLAGLAAGREHADQVTVFDSVGFALEDYSALRYVHELALERDIGEDVALVPPGANPKDLFGRIAAPGALRAVQEAA